MNTSGECQRKEYPEEFGNGVHLEEEEGVDPEILGCRNSDQSKRTRKFCSEAVILA